MDPKRELTMTFSWQTWQVISAALQELPFRVSSPILQQMQEQLNKIAAADAGAQPHVAAAVPLDHQDSAA